MSRFCRFMHFSLKFKVNLKVCKKSTPARIPLNSAAKYEKHFEMSSTVINMRRVRKVTIYCITCRPIGKFFYAYCGNTAVDLDPLPVSRARLTLVEPALSEACFKWQRRSTKCGTLKVASHHSRSVFKTKIHEAVAEKLGYRKLCARWVPKMLTEITKRNGWVPR
jgi:hypothetical protein